MTSIPLYPTTSIQTRRDLIVTGWADMKISIGYDKCLGFFVGRHATSDINFGTAMAKFRERGAYWLAQRKLGSFFQCVGFNMCALSVFSFISQLYIMSDKFMTEVTQLALKFMFGPAEWIHGTGGHPFLDLQLICFSREYLHAHRKVC